MATGFSFAVASELVRAGKTARLQKALDERSLNVEETDANGRTLLLVAAEFGRADVVAALINGGADVAAVGKHA